MATVVLYLRGDFYEENEAIAGGAQLLHKVGVNTNQNGVGGGDERGVAAIASEPYVVIFRRRSCNNHTS
jgi:hypothetical protein